MSKRFECKSPADGGVLIDIPLTHQDMANLIGSTRDTVTEQLNRFKREGRIRFENRRIRLQEAVKLEKEYP